MGKMQRPTLHQGSQFLNVGCSLGVNPAFFPAFTSEWVCQVEFIPMLLKPVVVTVAEAAIADGAAAFKTGREILMFAHGLPHAATGYKAFCFRSSV
jgi:hypothetical protein